MKKKYLDMITEALLHLNEREGSSRDQIWKYIKVKFNDSITDEKQFLTNLQRIAREDNHVECADKKMGRYKLTAKYRERFLNKTANGETMDLQRSKDMIKDSKNLKKKASKNKKAEMSKTAKGKETLKKKDEEKVKEKQTKRARKKKEES